MHIFPNVSFPTYTWAWSTTNIVYRVIAHTLLPLPLNRLRISQDLEEIEPCNSLRKNEKMKYLRRTLAAGCLDLTSILMSGLFTRQPKHLPISYYVPGTVFDAVLLDLCLTKLESFFPSPH